MLKIWIENLLISFLPYTNNDNYYNRLTKKNLILIFYLSTKYMFTKNKIINQRHWTSNFFLLICIYIICV